MTRSDGHRTRRAKDEVQYRNAEDLVVHDKAYGAAHRSSDQQRIDIGHVVANQHYRALLGNRVQSLMAHPVHGVAEQPHQKAHAEFRHDAEDVGADRHVHQRHHEKQLRNRQLRDTQQQDGDQRRRDHQQRIEDVICGHHPRPLMLRRARLDQRVQRHDVEAAEHTDAKHRGKNPPGLTDAQQCQPVMRHRSLRKAARPPPQQQAEQRQTKGAERHQPDLHLVAG